MILQSYFHVSLLAGMSMNVLWPNDKPRGRKTVWEKRSKTSTYLEVAWRPMIPSGEMLGAGVEIKKARVIAKENFHAQFS
jgi:hypothetical protein